MLTLSRIYLYNWHRFTDHLIEVRDSLYLAGHNGSGKSSVLDALQLVLVADLGQVRFNSSAQERSHRSLDSYVRGKLGEGGYLRPGNTLAYIALEFTDTTKDTHVTLGMCIEASADKAPDRTYFIIGAPLDRELFRREGRMLSRRELKQAWKQRKDAHTYDNSVGEYRDDLLNRLGGLSERFFSLFLRALTFQPIRDIRSFVEQWLLPEKALSLQGLTNVRDRLSELRKNADLVERQLSELNEIVGQQDEVRGARDLAARYTLLIGLLELEVAARRVRTLNEAQQTLTARMATLDQQLTERKAMWNGAQDALLQAEIQLRQSDVIRRRDDLQREQGHLQAEIAARIQRWERLQGELRQQTRALEPALAAPLHDSERAALDALIESVGGLGGEVPAALATQIDEAIEQLDSALERVRQERTLLGEEVRQLRTQHDAAQQQLNELRQGKKARYPEQVEKLRELLEARMGKHPALLCELLEIPDERWQDAVEAMLGPRRFNIVVPPEQFKHATLLLDQARREQRIYNAGIIDLERSWRDGRPAQPGSLAEQVRPKSTTLQSYVNTVLGDIITCESVDELREHRRAITSDVVVYGEFTVRAQHPDSYRPWYVGKRAATSQIEALETQLRDLNKQLTDIAPKLRDLTGLERVLDRGRELARLRERLEQPLDAKPLRAELAQIEQELAELDLSGVAALEAEVLRLKALTEQERERYISAERERASCDANQRTKDQQLQEAQRKLADQQHRTMLIREEYAPVSEAAEELLAERLKATRPLEDVLQNASSSLLNYQTRVSNALRKLNDAALLYNTHHSFDGIPNNPDDPSYLTERDRLASTDLPSYRTQIEQAERDAEEELREHVLHRLREQISDAKDELRRLNATLEGLEFHGERYRFRFEPADDVHDYYELIEGSAIIGTSLYESAFYKAHQDAFDSFYGAITAAPHNDADIRRHQRLIDYRSYLSYDIEVIHGNGERSRLSKIMGQTSGGETQTPFYLTIAASFVQLYDLQRATGRPTIRLVAFDEAFSKMDQDRIGSTLDLFNKFKLQIVTATPLERCEYLVPKMCTNLVLSAARRGTSVVIEPYHNYHASNGDATL